MNAVEKSEVLRAEIRGIQERILQSDLPEGGNVELRNIPCMPQRNGLNVGNCLLICMVAQINSTWYQLVISQHFHRGLLDCEM